jgi:hypothetical protein
MPNTLPSGAPYLLGTDPGNQIDNVSLSNAQYWDARTPRATATGTTGTFAASSTVTFPVGRFSAAPVVIATPVSSATTATSATVASVTSTGFTAYRWAGGAAASVPGTVNWRAVQYA